MPFAIALPLVALCVAVFLLMVAKSWDATFGPMLEAMASYFDNRTFRIKFAPDIHFDWAARAFRSVNAKVRAGLLAGIVYTSGPLVLFLRYMAQVLERPVLELADLTADVFHTLGQLRRVVIPAMIAAALGPVAAIVYMLRGQVASLAHRAPVHIVHDITHVVTKATTTVVRDAVAIPQAGVGRLGREVAVITSSIGSLEHAARVNLAKIRKLERSIAGAGAVALVATALATMGLSWIRCPSLKRIGRKHGCAPWQMLEDMLGGVFVALAATDLCRWTALMTGAAERALPVFLALVDVENALIGCHGNTAPAQLHVTGYSATPVVDAVKLAA